MLLAAIGRGVGSAGRPGRCKGRRADLPPILADFFPRRGPPDGIQKKVKTGFFSLADPFDGGIFRPLGPEIAESRRRRIFSTPMRKSPPYKQALSLIRRTIGKKMGFSPYFC
jgi:hypothetical protein